MTFNEYFVDDENYLEHYGVPGMRWGVRKATRYGVKKANRTDKARGKVYVQRKRVDSAKKLGDSPKRIARLEKSLSKRASKYTAKKKEFSTYGKAFSKQYGSEKYDKFMQKATAKVARNRWWRERTGVQKTAMMIPTVASLGLDPVALVPKWANTGRNYDLIRERGKLFENTNRVGVPIKKKKKDESNNQ